MTNLGQECLFSNLITIPVQWCGFCSVSWKNSSLFTVFKVGIYWEMIKISKGVRMAKWGKSIVRGWFFFSSLWIKTFRFCSCFSRYYTKRKIPRINLMTALLFWILWLRYEKNFKVFWTLIWTPNMYFKHWFPYMSEHCAYPGLTANCNAPFCFDLMDCLDFFSPGFSSSLLKRIFKIQFSFRIWI